MTAGCAAGAEGGSRGRGYVRRHAMRMDGMRSGCKNCCCPLERSYGEDGKAGPRPARVTITTLILRAEIGERAPEAFGGTCSNPSVPVRLARRWSRRRRTALLRGGCDEVAAASKMGIDPPRRLCDRLYEAPRG